jgi:uncharacterized protein
MGARVKCPTCGKVVVWDVTSPWRPFCSERCKTTDLGAWAAERYRVAGASLAQAEELPPSEPARGGTAH